MSNCFPTIFQPESLKNGHIQHVAHDKSLITLIGLFGGWFVDVLGHLLSFDVARKSCKSQNQTKQGLLPTVTHHHPTFCTKHRSHSEDKWVTSWDEATTIQSQTQLSLSRNFETTEPHQHEWIRSFYEVFMKFPRGSSLTFIFCSSESRKSLTSACPDRPMHFPTSDPEPKTYTLWGSWTGSLTRFHYPEWWTPLSNPWQRYYLSIRFKLYIPRVFWHCFHLHRWTIFWISLIQSAPHEFTHFFLRAFPSAFLEVGEFSYVTLTWT